jgi:hypothetical protein
MDPVAAHGIPFTVSTGSRGPVRSKPTGCAWSHKSLDQFPFSTSEACMVSYGMGSTIPSAFHGPALAARLLAVACFPWLVNEANRQLQHAE